MFFLTLLLSSLFQRPWFGIGLTWSAVSIISFINTNKIALRQNPLLPEDFQLADQVGALSDFVDFWSIFRLIIACLLILIACILLDYVTNDFFLPPKHKVKRSAFWLRHQLLPRAVLVTIAITGAIVSTEFIRHHSGDGNEQIDWLDTTFIAWNQKMNYDTNGFLIGFLYNLESFDLEAPDDYSEESVKQIASTYSEKASAANRSLPSLASQDYNIVVVLNESFYDPDIIRQYYHYDGEVTPTWRSIRKKYPSGYMYSPEYGGGTANIEFEVLSSLSNYWNKNVPYTHILPKLDSIPTIASYAKENGYQTTAIHPYNGGMYKRNYALKTEGFDEFITEDEIEFTETEPGSSYINDRSAYKQVLSLINSRSQKQMIGLITMQNHAPFSNKYDKKVISSDSPVIGSYLELLNRSDAYLGEFLNELDQQKEKTVVLFFGDHAPGLFIDLTTQSDQSMVELAHLTPYFIYSNFDLPNSKNTKTTTMNTLSDYDYAINFDYDYQLYEDYYGYGLETIQNHRTTTKDLPTTTPNCLVNTLYTQLGVQKPSLQYLVADFCEKYPTFSSVYYSNSDPEPSTLLNNYQQINYDTLSGNQYYLQNKEDD